MALQFGCNVYLNLLAQRTINALHCAQFWQLSTSTSGANQTFEEWNAWVDANGNLISNNIGANGAAISGTNALIFTNGSMGTYLYPGGANSWKLKFNGRGTFTMLRDITSPASTSVSPTLLTVTASANGLGMALSATGFSVAATFSGTTVTMTGSNFTTDTPVAFQTSGALPSPLMAGTVYYVLAGATANTFSIATTKGGSAITFTGGSGTHTGFGDWARDIVLYQVAHETNLNNGEIWNPDYVKILTGLNGPIRFMDLDQASNYGNAAACSFSGTTVTLTPDTVNFLPKNAAPAVGQTIVFDADVGSTLPSPLNTQTAYYVVSVTVTLHAAAGTTGNYITASTCQIATTPGGTPITFSGGVGTAFHATTRCIAKDTDITPSSYLTWFGPSYSGVGVYGWGIPIEAMCDLCNRLNVPLWMNIPPYADNSWGTTAAQKVSANLNTALDIILEPRNEVWAFGGLNNSNTAFKNRGYALFPTAGSDYNAGCLYNVYSAIQNYAQWSSVFASDGRPSRLIRCFGGQASNDAYLFDATQGMLKRLGSDYGGSSSYWTGQAYTHFDAVCIAHYMTDSTDGQLPDAWTASPNINGDSDGGLKMFYNQYSGAVSHLPEIEVTTGAWTTTPITVAGTGTYTCTSGKGLPATPPNGTALLVTFTNGTSAAATLAVDGGTAFPLQDKKGVAFPSADAGGISNISNGYTTVVIFTNATASGAVTAGWRLTSTFGSAWGAKGLHGNSVRGRYWSTTCRTQCDSLGLRMLSYEGGQTFSDFGQADTDQANYSIAANQSSQIGQVYTAYYDWFKNNTSIGFNDYICHYADIGTPSNQSQWGLLENIYQTGYSTVPKYQAYMQEIAGIPHGGHSWIGRF